MIVGAEAGLMHITGQADGPPTKPGVSLVDLCTGLYLHGAIMGALLASQNTGKGQKIDVSLFETQVALLINVGMDWINLGQEAQRWGSAHPSVVPYDAWKTKDSYLVTGATTERQFRNLSKILGNPALADDERFNTNEIRVKNRDELLPILRQAFEARTTDEWLALFEGSGMPYGSINNMERVFKHPQIEARKMVQSVAFDGLKSGSLKLLGSHCSSPCLTCLFL
jgi:succinate--hydroxymethylglutarate CoA-transferase